MEDSQCRALSEKLKTEFELKRKQLNELETEVNSLLNTDGRKRISLQQCNTDELKHENIDGIMCLRHKLDKITSKLRTIHTEGSPEHVHLKSVHEQLLRIHRTRETTTLNTSSDFQNLAHLVTDLQTDHECNCQLKEEIENKVNEGYRQTAKQQFLLGRRCSESSNPADKENVDRLLDDFVMQHINPQKLSLQNQAWSNPNKSSMSLDKEHQINQQKSSLQREKEYFPPKNSCMQSEDRQSLKQKKLPLRDKN